MHSGSKDGKGELAPGHEGTWVEGKASHCRATKGFQQKILNICDQLWILEHLTSKWYLNVTGRERQEAGK